MIHITQGHEKSISTEILIKTLQKFSQKSLNKIMLYFSKDTLGSFIRNSYMDVSLKENFLNIESKKVQVVNVDEINFSQTLSSLELALTSIKKDDILITMPTSKNQLNTNNMQYNGHTDFFRKKYNENTAMLFKYEKTFCLLLTDHIPLSQVHQQLPRCISEVLPESLNSLTKHFNFNGEIYIAGINPHAGENGILGTEEELLMPYLLDVHKKHNFTKPFFLPADTIHHFHNRNRKQLFIYFYHDQGLTFFKHCFGLFGINISLNLPFLRMSVDHGTAFGLYNKDTANTLGMYYVLNEALKVHG